MGKNEYMVFSKEGKFAVSISKSDEDKKYLADLKFIPAEFIGVQELKECEVAHLLGYSGSRFMGINQKEVKRLMKEGPKYKGG